METFCFFVVDKTTLPKLTILYARHQITDKIQPPLALKCVMQFNDEGVVHGFEDESFGEGVDFLLAAGDFLF